MARASRIFLALLVLATGAGHGARVAIGSQGLADLAAGDPAHSSPASAPRTEVSVLGVFHAPAGSDAKRPTLRIGQTLWLPEGSDAGLERTALRARVWPGRGIRVAAAR